MYIVEQILKRTVIANVRTRAEVTSRWNQLFIKTKVTEEMRHKTCEIVPSNLKASDWQTMDTYCFVPFALSLIGPEALIIVMLSYSFLVRILYMHNDVLQLTRM